jgi:molybdopterin-guanine dinucleotide biosynthesis protein A
MTMIDCVIFAGGVPKAEDPLYAYTLGQPKALLDIAGKPMIQWVLDALTHAPHIGRIIIVGFEADSDFTSSKIAAYVPDQKALLANIIAGVDRLAHVAPEARYLLACTADIPTITPEIVENLVVRWESLRADTEADLYYHIVPRALMETRFPGSNRSYVHLVEGDFAGADIHIFAPHIAHTHRELWNALLSDRKNALKQAARLGGDFFLKLFTRRLSIAELERRVPERLGLKVKAVPVEHAEVGMDVDKPFQLDICKQELARYKR